MMLQRVCRFLLWGAVAGALLGCEETGGIATPSVPVAGLRYVNIVSDTGALDIRIVDIIGDAPATFGATFRTGGSPSGAGLQTSPPYQAVEAGTRRIRAFNSSSDPAIAQQMLLETSFTFDANRNYTSALHGFARAGQTPQLAAAILADDTPSIPAGQIAVRTWHLAPTLDPSGTTPLDAWVVAPGASALSGPPTIAGQSYPDRSLYQNVAPGSYRVAFTAAGTTQPILFQANMPPGTPGTAPIAGTTVAGTGMTVLVVPRSLPGSRAPFPFTGIQGMSALTSNVTTGGTAPDTTATAVTPAAHNLATADSIIINGANQGAYNVAVRVTVVDATTFTYRMKAAPSASPATGYPFWLPASQGPSFNGVPDSSLTSSGTTATLVTQTSHGLATNDIITVSGANEPEYNGSFVVTRVSATRVTYTTNGVPSASPAAGAPVWRRRIDDFTRPNIMFLIDRRP